MRALAGLGNPGEEYSRTRHNVGWMLLDRIRAAGRDAETRDKEWVQLERLKFGPDTIWLLRPSTYMNSSGAGVAQAAKSLQIEPADILVAYDDIDLPLGTIRIRRNGGAGGHNGMKSVIAELGTQRFPRLRLGVRGEGRGPDTADYVLSPFADDELETVQDMLDRAVAAVRMTLRRGLGTAMNHYNQKPVTPTTEEVDAPVSAAGSRRPLPNKESPE